MARRRPTVAAVALVGLVALTLGGYALNRGWVSWSGGSAERTPAAGKSLGVKGGKGSGGFPVAVEVAKVATRTLQEDVTAVGTLRSNEAVVVRPEISGRIVEIGLTEGARVEKGRMLVALDASVNAAEVQQAKANLSLAQTSYNRTIELEREKFVSATARDQALNALRVAEASLALAEARLAKTTIRAPFGGVVGLRQVSVGDFVKEGQDLATLEDISSLKVDFRLPEAFLPDLKRGQTLEVVSDTLPGRSYPATLDAIDPVVDQNGRALILRGRMKNADGALRPGMFVRTRVILAERPGALVVPEEALVPVGQEQFVYRVVGGKAERVRVRTGRRRDAQVEIVEGLAAGDVVVTAGQIKLRDGAAVSTGPGGPPPAAGGAGPGAPVAPGKQGGA